MPLVISGATSGQTTIQATDAVTATITLPSTSGTVVVNNGAQTIEFADGSASAPSITNSGDTNTGIFFPAADTIAFTEGGTESMRIDSSGNLGLGVTPSAWASGYKSLEVGGIGNALVSNGGTDTRLYMNTYYNASANNTYARTGAAALYAMVSTGQHQWFTAPSGTAGTTATLTQVMTLDNSGNLGIGKATPTAPLSFADAAGTAGTTNKISLFWAAGESLGLYGFGVSAGQLDYVTGGAHVFYSKASNTSTERMRLDSSGNLGLAAVPSAWNSSYKAFQNGSTALFSYSGNDRLGLAQNVYIASGGSSTYINTAAASQYLMINNSHNWYIAPSGTAGNTISFTQAMTLDASGNLQIGTTSAGSIVPAMSIVRGGTTWQLGPSVPSGGGNTFYVVNSGGTGVYLVSGNTSWTASSDERLKTDLIPIENAAEKVSTLRAVTGRFKTDDEGTSRSFLIAQDVQAVLPEAVNVQDDEQGTLGVQYTDVIPLLVAAIKELKAIVDTQAEQIKALQGAA